MLTIGLRNIIKDVGLFKPSAVDVDYNIDKFRPHQNSDRKYRKIVKAAVNTIEHVQLEVDVPKNKSITPVMDVFVMNKNRGKKEVLLGVGKFNMFKYMEKISRKAEGVLGMLDGDSDDDDDDAFE